ncbi:hypothetical protein VUR80DRAFT_6276 [Thermomyces stellatus]
MPALSIPTNARLPSSLRVPSSDPAARKILARLSRASLLSLVLSWLDDGDYPISQPYLESSEEARDSDDFYPPASSLGQLRRVYSDIQARKGSKREVIERILEGDWRHGLTLYQLAMADLQHLYDHPTSHKWSTYRIVPLGSSTSASDEQFLKIDKKSLSIPRIHPSTFLEHLQSHVLPDVKAHFQFDRSPSLRMVILRILIIDSPYNTNIALFNGEGRGPSSALNLARTVYVAFPDNAPFIYISNLLTVGPPNPAETKNFRGLISDGIRKALSKPRERYTLISTGMTTRNLRALVHLRGASRFNAAGGGWGIYAKEATLDTPLDETAQLDALSEVSGNVKAIPQEKKPSKRARSGTNLATPSNKRAKLAARARFGNSAKVTDGHGLERVEILMEDPFCAVAERLNWGGKQWEGGPTARSSSSWTANVKITMQGPHVFAGIRQLVEGGVIDGERMPGWLTGEENVTAGIVRDGRLQAHKAFDV